MKDDYAPRVCVSLAEGTLVEHPPDMPELVHMHDPATYVFTDFTHNRPVVIAPDVSIDVAMNKMKSSGVGLLLVIDQAGAVIGEITIADILGDVPVRMAQESGMDHSEIVVDMVMTPRKDIKVLEWSHMKDGKVGHIVATLHQLECCHLLVVEDDRVRGLFAVSEISRHLGHDVSETACAAHSLAEIVHTLG